LVAEVDTGFEEFFDANINHKFPWLRPGPIFGCRAIPRITGFDLMLLWPPRFRCPGTFLWPFNSLSGRDENALRPAKGWAR
jgi:hypothetical protein